MENLKGHHLPSSHHLLSQLPPSDFCSPPPKSCFQWTLSCSSSSSSSSSPSSAIAAASDSSDFRFPWNSDTAWASTTASDPLSSRTTITFHGASSAPRRDVVDFLPEKKYDGIVDCFNPNLAVSELGNATTSMTMPFSCKLDALAGAERQFGLPPLGCGFRSFDKPDMVGDRSSESFLNDGGDGGGQAGCVASVKKDEGDSAGARANSGGPVSIASLEDGSIGLKLGKRTYYEDASAEAMETPKRASVSLMPTVVSNGNSTAANAVSATTTLSAAPVRAKVAIAGATVANKRQKNSSLLSVVPKCQAEGCTADLSGAKDYHRRHKVCELHSKASKAMVANLEQRFCQQCSRFHVLSEFDEGKRSCRRRLAGHNERRRKPPQEPMPFLSPGFALFGDSRINALLENPYFLQARRAVALGSTSNSALSNAALACQLGLAGLQQAELDAESIRSYPAVELHRLLQSCAGGGHQPDAGGRANGMVGSNGHYMSNPLPSASSVASSIQDLLTNSQPSPETAVSGRALSLLSSSLGSQVGPRSMSTSLGMNMNSASPACLDQLFSDFQASSSSSSSRHIVAPIASPITLNGNAAIVPGTYGLRVNNLVSGLHSLTSSSSGCSVDMEEGKSLTMSSFGQSRPTFSMLPDKDFDNSIQHSGGSSGHGRQMLDLMQVSSIKESPHPQQQAQVPYADIHRLSIFGGTSII